MQAQEAVTRSYRNAEVLRTGDAVVVRADVGSVRKGAEGRLLNLSNGGFRGIEASVMFDGGGYAVISAGYLVPAWAW